MEQQSEERYEAYNAFMRRHRESVWCVCYDYARGDKACCEDMVQEVWVMAWLKFDQLSKKANVWQQRAWVRRVARSVLVDLYRKEHPPTEPITVEMEETIAAVDNGDAAERIDDLMASLTTDEQHLMRMRLEGYSAEEIAADFNIEPNAVYQRVNRIMTKLRKKYGKGL